MSRAAPRPRIAVTGKASRWAPGWWCARAAIALAGGRALRATPRRGLPATLDGLVIGGGDDIATDLYLSDAAPDARADRERDAFELAAIRTARASGTPVLGICRGAQLLNVAAGGTLYADLGRRRRRTSDRANPLPCKRIVLKRGSRLAAIAGRRRMAVNGLHHQAVRGLGAGFTVSARDADGLIQAIETVDRTFTIGVQWHPEYLCYQRPQRRLFAALVAAARRRPGPSTAQG